MQGSLWLMVSLVLIAGALGGWVNSLMADQKSSDPQRSAGVKRTTKRSSAAKKLPAHKATQADSKTEIWRPGYAVNAFIGAVAALVSCGLYGPLSAYFIAGTKRALEANMPPETVGLSLASVVGAILIGIGGARWLTNEVDKTLLRATATTAAGKGPDPLASQRIALASPARALEVAKAMGR
jgi:hypothetical protein